MQKPNVLLIMSDQQRADFFVREGFPSDTMPFLERIALRGCWFERAYTPEPICVPARVSMLTGRYSKATGVMVNSHNPCPNYLIDLPDFLGA
ncbi:MAG: sulfatase-like hydrolase/transferase [bacterium]|nr:sulfatase-like hydrolase/transferase [bacterium]